MTLPMLRQLPGSWKGFKWVLNGFFDDLGPLAYMYVCVYVMHVYIRICVHVCYTHMCTYDHMCMCTCAQAVYLYVKYRAVEDDVTCA